MNLYSNSGLTLSLVLCALLLARHRMNVLRSFPFVINALFLVTYYLPFAYIDGLVNEKASWLILAGHICMNLGLLAGQILMSVPYSPNKTLPAGDKAFFRIPSNGFIMLMFISGVSGYLVLYATRGIPIFSEDLGVAREAFITGAGFLTWPSSVLINLSVWLMALQRHNKTALVLGLAGASTLALSGWRGQIIFMVLSLLFAISYRNGINKRVALIGIVGFLGIAVFGIIRSNLGGHALYGLQLGGESGFDAAVDVLSLGGLYVMHRLGEHAFNFNVAISHFHANHLGGAGLVMDFLFLLPGKNVTTGGYMKDLFGKWEGGGGMPITMIGGFFADFGVAGVVSLSFFATFIQTLFNKVLARLSLSNQLYYIPLGFINTFWVFGFLGTYFRDFLPITLIYTTGTLVVFYCYFTLTTVRSTIFRRGMRDDNYVS